VALGLVALVLAACQQQPTLQVPPPPPVTVARPLLQTLPDYAHFTGQTAPVNAVDLVARVPGFLRSVDYVDGTDVAAGRTLFVIEQDQYKAQVALSQATVDQNEAQLKSAQAEFERQEILRQEVVSTQANYDRALANRDSARAAVAQAQANLELAKINLAYTTVTAPFAGRVSRHLVDAGNLVGQGTATTLATIQDLSRIYVYFTASEQDVLRFRTLMTQRGMTFADIEKLPLEMGLQNETNYPHRGRIDYVDTGLNAASGTLQVRAVIDNPSRALIPGLFARVRIPMGEPRPQLRLPETAFGMDQIGSYVLTVDANQTVATRRVVLGALEGGLRAVTSGLNETDLVVIDGLQNASPGRKVTPREGTVQAPVPTAKP